MIGWPEIISAVLIVGLSLWLLVRLGVIEIKDAILGTSLGAAIFYLWMRLSSPEDKDEIEEDNEVVPDSEPTPDPTHDSEDAHDAMQDEIEDTPDDLQSDLEDLADRLRD